LVRRQVIDLDTSACVHWFRIDGPAGELYDLGRAKVVRPLALGLAANEILGLITHDQQRLLSIERKRRSRSACGTKRTSISMLNMSAFGCKADSHFRGCRVRS